MDPLNKKQYYGFVIKMISQTLRDMHADPQGSTDPRLGKAALEGFKFTFEQAERKLKKCML